MKIGANNDRMLNAANAGAANLKHTCPTASEATVNKINKKSRAFNVAIFSSRALQVDKGAAGYSRVAGRPAGHAACHPGRLERQPSTIVVRDGKRKRAVFSFFRCKFAKIHHWPAPCVMPSLGRRQQTCCHCTRHSPAPDARCNVHDLARVFEPGELLLDDRLASIFRDLGA